MMHLKNISAPLIDPRGKHSGVLPLFTEDGRDWYEEQKKFQPHTLKMMYDNNGIIRSVSKDVSLLCPDGMSVIELPDTDEYRKVDNTGDWLVKDVQIVKREGPEQRENSPISIGAESVPFRLAP
ncbi:tail fiber assembly protein (plasmid) [Escherichia coli]